MPKGADAVTRTMPLAPCLHAVAALLLSAGTAGAQEVFVPQAFRADLEALTAPEMAGREPGTPGGERAERYLATRFAAIGLAQLPGAPEHLQTFSIEDPRPVRLDAEGTQLRIVAPGAETSAAELGRDFVPFGFSVEGRCAAPLVFAGHGLVVPALDRDDYAGLDVAGAVVLVLRGAPGHQGPEHPLRDHRDALTFTAKIAAAAARGAKGFLLVDPTAAADVVARAASARGTASIPAAWMRWAVAVPALEALGVDPARIATGEPGAMDRQGKVQVELAVAFEEPRAPRRTANVVGWLPGADPKRCDQMVVVGAHHDHIGSGEFGSLAPGAVGRVHPGADDNASGCAALLMVAEHFARSERLPRSLVFVAFGAEELGLRGSSHALDTELLPPARVAAMVNLNMIGRATPERLRIEGVGTGSGLAGIVARASVAVGRPVQTRAGASPRSDHAAFHVRGIPALFVHSGLHDAYHTPDDRACRVLVPEAVEVARLAAAIVGELARSPARPAFRDVERSGFRRR